LRASRCSIASNMTDPAPLRAICVQAAAATSCQSCVRTPDEQRLALDGRGVR
jgi:hypothetical protein